MYILIKLHAMVEEPNTERIKSLPMGTQLKSSQAENGRAQAAWICCELGIPHQHSLFNAWKAVRSITPDNCCDKFAEKGKREAPWVIGVIMRLRDSFSLEDLKY
jgi:hypothetical protein